MKIKASYLKRFFVSYALILLPSFIIFTLFASGIFSMMREEVRTSLQTELDHFISKYELQYQSFELMALRLSLDSEMATNKIDYTKSSSLRSIQKLNEVKLYDAAIYDAFLCFDQTHIYASAGLSSIDTFMYRYLRLSGTESGERFRSVLFDMNQKGIFYLQSANHPGYLYYHYPVSMERSYNFASINFLVELDMIEKMLEGISRGYDSVIALALPTGETIVFRETGSHEFSIETVPTLAAAFSGRTDYSTLVSYSEKTEATFYIASRIPLMYAHIIRLQIISYVLLALLLLAALAVSYLFSKRNSAPIQQLARVFTSQQQNQPGSSSFNNEDEISFIRQMINITIDENMKMNQVMLASSNLLSQQTMMLLFHGVLNNRAVVNQMMELSNLVLDEAHYAVLLVSAGSKDKIVTVNLDACYEKLWALPECDLGCNIMIEDQKVMALLVGLPNEDASKIQRMNICRRLVQACSSNCDVSAKICSSRVYDDIEQVNQAYIEAVYVFKANQSKINSNQLTFFDDILTFDLPIVTLSKKETDAFQNAVRALDKNKMELRFDYIMQLIQKEDISENTRTAMRYRILNLLLHCVMEMGIEQDILSDIMDIDPSQNEMFRQQMAIVFDKISLQKNAPTEGAFNEILHDLHENYGDVNLSLESVAQRAGLSKAYVSRLFKLKTGKRYIDYLTDIRMKETMKLLVNTKLSVREITQKVGYYDVASFQKKFKMLYGLSPAKYRDAHGNNLIDNDTPSRVNGNRHPAGISKKL